MAACGGSQREALLEEAGEFAHRPGRPIAVPQRALRRLMADRGSHQSLPAALEAGLQVGIAVGASEDAAEGARAILEKRPAEP